MSERATWRAAVHDDLDAIVAVQDRVHTLESENRDVFAAKLQAFPNGIRVLAGENGIVGYGVFHPWRLGQVPSLNALPFALPAHLDCLFVHDVGLLPVARGQGAVTQLLGAIRDAARSLSFEHLALVSVYDTAPFWGHLGFIDHPLRFDPEKRAQYGSAARYMVAPAGVAWADANNGRFAFDTARG